MIADTLLIIIGIAGLSIASLIDIKTKEIPDWLNYSMIASGLGIRLIYSTTINDYSFFLYGLLGAAILFVIGSIMYYTKQWGGGDAKLIAALGAIFATVPNQRFFLVSLLINIIIIGAVYGMVFVIALALKNYKKFKLEYINTAVKNKKQKKSYMFITISLILVAILFKSSAIRIIFIVLAVLVLSNFYLLLMIRSVEKIVLFKYIPTSRLTEGDWIAKNIYINKKLVYNKDSPGVNKKQLSIIKKSKIKEVLIKDGIPFVPSILIAAVLTLVFGNLLMHIINKLI